MEQALDEGIFYLIEELAFLCSSPNLFEADRVANIYHKRWPIYEDLVAGKFGGRPRNNLGYIILK